MQENEEKALLIEAIQENEDDPFAPGFALVRLSGNNKLSASHGFFIEVSLAIHEDTAPAPVEIAWYDPIEWLTFGEATSLFGDDVVDDVWGNQLAIVSVPDDDTRYGNPVELPRFIVWPKPPCEFAWRCDIGKNMVETHQLSVERINQAIKEAMK